MYKKVHNKQHTNKAPTPNRFQKLRAADNS